MTWQKVETLAEEHGLALYRPLCGYHKLVQITDTHGNPVSWTSNKARSAMQSVQAIIKQRELSALSDDQAIADGIAAKEQII